MREETRRLIAYNNAVFIKQAGRLRDRTPYTRASNDDGAALSDARTFPMPQPFLLPTAPDSSAPPRRLPAPSRLAPPTARLAPPPPGEPPAPRSAFVPAPPALFVGRRREIDRVLRALERLPLAVLYGVPGSGKSALAYACGAAWSGPVVHAQIRQGGSLDSLVDEIGTSLGRRRGERRGDEAQGVALADALEERGALLLLDDVDLLPPPAREALLGALGERLRRGRVVVTSRSRLPSPQRYDRLELPVAGLDEPSARRLWRGLDRLRGPKAGFAEAYRRAKGCPSALRRAHAGELSDLDPYAPLVQALGPDARAIAFALAALDAPLGADALYALLPSERADAARRELAGRLLVEIDGADACSLSPPAREAVVSALLPPAAMPSEPPPSGEQLSAAYLSPGEAPWAGEPAVIDAHRHELRAGGRVLCLHGRPVLRGLLYALASRPNVVVSKEALVNEVWSVRYHPHRHDNALFVNIRRLRAALEGTGLAVHNRDGGYALSAPAGFVPIGACP